MKRKTNSPGSGANRNVPPRPRPVVRSDMPRMLLVDVSRPMRRLLVKMLKKSSPDILVAVAGSVAEAVRTFDVLRPKTILLNLDLPDGGGLEVLRHAMALDPYCMVVVLASRADAKTRLECFEEGADFVFDKSAALERAVATAQQASRRQLFRTPRRPIPRRFVSEEFVLANKSGLHVLPAARLVKLAGEYRAKIEIACADRTANAKDLMEVLALGAECGARITVTAAGTDAAQGLAGIRSLVAKKFHDDAELAGTGRNPPGRPPPADGQFHNP